MQPRLDGKVAIVMGAGSVGESVDDGIGNGRAIALVLAREGARIVVADQNYQSAQLTSEAIARAGGTAIPVEADATCASDCETLVLQALGAYSSLDILVNNVGMTGPQSSVVDVDFEVWQSVINANLTSVVTMSRYAIPAMSFGAAVVNIASIAALRATERVAYAASKAGVVGLTATMAAQHGPAGIRVNAVCPGAVWTPMVFQGLPDGPRLQALRERRRLSTMLKTEGTGWDIAHAVLFLASEEARWITGQALVVDGGLTQRLAYEDDAYDGDKPDRPEAVK